jgi:hypothetical protein
MDTTNINLTEVDLRWLWDFLSTITATRMRAPYVNKDGFRFKIYPKDYVSRFRRLFGIKRGDIEVGFPELDRSFIIKGNEESKVRTLFANPRIRQWIHSEPRIYLAVRNDDGPSGPSFPQGVDELCLHVPDVVKDIEQLKSLFELFEETLNQLCQMGSATEEDPNVIL